MTLNNLLTHPLFPTLQLARLRPSTNLGLVLIATFASSVRADTPSKFPDNEKQIIGPTAVVEEAESDMKFPARVDTGATTSSLHVEESKVVDEASKMTENVGKKIRFRIKNHRGESEWLERKIAEISVIKTSEREEWRYKVPITLNCLDVKKRVLVSLNDRSHMTYPVLLGRNFLQGDFVVDVDLDKQDIAKQDIDKQDIDKQDIAKQDIAKQDIAKQDIAKQDIAKQDIAKGPRGKGSQPAGKRAEPQRNSEDAESTENAEKSAETQREEK